MQLSTKCSIAVHCLIFIHEAQGRAKVTSKLLALSTGCNPVVIRNLFGALKRAGLIEVARGAGGAALLKPPEEINLYMIYSAIEPSGLSSMIGVHSCDGRMCPIARNIRGVLQTPYRKIEDSVRRAMEETTLASMIEDYRARLSAQQG